MPVKEQNQTKSPPKEPVVSEEKASPSVLKLIQEKELFSWKAPLRSFKRRNKEFWTTVVVIAGIFGIILYLIEGIMPVILIISIAFLFYVLSTVEPEEIEYKITNLGVKIADKTTSWEFLTRYWFSKRYNSTLMIFEMITLPGRLELVIHDKDKDNLRKQLNQYIVEEEASPSNMDKAANWFSKKLPENK